MRQKAIRTIGNAVPIIWIRSEPKPHLSHDEQDVLPRTDLFQKLSDLKPLAFYRKREESIRLRGNFN